MSFTFPSIAETDAAAWDALVRQSPDGWVFSLHGWQRVVTDVDAWGFEERGFAIREGKRLLAVVPLHYRPSHKVMASSGWGGSGPVMDAALSPTERDRVMAAALARMGEIAQADHAEALEVSCYPVTASSIGNRWGVNPYQRHGFEDVSLLSQVIDLSASEEEIWNGFSQSARQAVRKAEKAGFRTERVDWGAMLDTYYDCHVETYERTGVTPHPRRYFSGIAAQTAPAGASVLYAAYSAAGEPVAFHNDARWGAGSNYHTGCSRASTRETGLDYLLMWTALRDARAAGCLWYDCGWVFPGSADSKQQGLTLFKTRFGGELHRAFRARRGFAPTPVAADTPPVQEDVTLPHPPRPGLLSRLARTLGRS